MSRLYPDVEERRSSEGYLEKNCNQIFVKGPALTRDLLEKVQRVEIGPHNTYLLGYKFNTRQLWVLAGLLLLFLLSCSGAIVMFFTGTFDNLVFNKLEINNESSGYGMWLSPSPKPLIKLYIFNYTNVPEYERGDDAKLNVKEAGPYIYEVALDRINVQFNGSLVTYQEKREYKFMPELSAPQKQNDRVIVPNLPLLTAASMVKHSSFLTRVGVSSLFSGLNARPFLTLPADRFIVGYEDSLYSLSKNIRMLQNEKPIERFGLVASKNGIGNDVITVNRGTKDINRVAVIEKYNGQSRLDYWSTKSCNSLNGASDGSMYSPKKVRNKQPVHFYMKEFCRPLPLHFQKQVMILNGKVPAYRYTLPHHIFDSPDRTPSNQCYCNMDLGECPPQGVFNATPCNFGAPAFMSLPHFYNGDPSLKEGVTGLNPDPTNFESYVDLHPTFGFVMAGKTRLQLNIQVAKSFGITQVNMFEDGLMLPVAWFEVLLEDKSLPEDMVGLIFQTTFTVKSVELGLKFGCLLTAIVTFVSVLIVVKNRMRVRGASRISPDLSVE